MSQHLSRSKLFGLDRAFTKRTNSGFLLKLELLAVAVDVTVAEIHATAIRKLDRNGSPSNASEDHSSEEAPE